MTSVNNIRQQLYFGFTETLETVLGSFYIFQRLLEMQNHQLWHHNDDKLIEMCHCDNMILFLDREYLLFVFQTVFHCDKYESPEKNIYFRRLKIASSKKDELANSYPNSIRINHLKLIFDRN